MSLQVKLHPLLVKRASSKQGELSVPFSDGMRPADIIRTEGFSDTDADAIMVLINDTQAEMDTPVNDGDRIEFMVGISGGASPRT